MKNFPIDFEDFTSQRIYCNSFVATAIIGAGVVGGLATAYSANQASKAQQAAADRASNTALGMFDTTNENLAPYRNVGQVAAGELTTRLQDLTSPIIMDQATLENTPGYQFTRTQGLKAVQNSAAARGLGTSGAALKGAATFATGLADATYKTQFDIANTNKTNAYTRLKGLVDTGETAAAGGAAAGAYAGNTSANAQIAGGNAAAAGANALGTAVNNTANNLSGYAIAKGLYGNQNPATPASVPQNTYEGNIITPANAYG